MLKKEMNLDQENYHLKSFRKDWEKAQKNVATFKGIFRKDFVEVVNDDDLPSLMKKAKKLYSKLLTWSSAFAAVTNLQLHGEKRTSE